MGRRPAGVLLVLVLAGGTALAATTLDWADSEVALGAIDPPIQFSAGANADNPRYMKSFQLSTNATFFNAEVRPRAGAEMTVTDVVRISNVGAQAYGVTLTGQQITASNVQSFEWDIYDGTTLVATFDYLAPSPEASFTLPAGETFQHDLRIDLKEGAGRHNAAIPFDLRLGVTV